MHVIIWLKTIWLSNYTSGSSKVLEQQQEVRQEQEDELKEQAEQVKAHCAIPVVEFMLAAGKEGQVFGSVSSKEYCCSFTEKRNSSR